MKIEVVTHFFFCKITQYQISQILFSGNLTVKMCYVHDRQFWLVLHIDANSPEKGQMNNKCSMKKEDKNCVQRISWEAS